MALAGRQIVVVVVEPIVPFCGGGWHAADCVEGFEERGCGGEVGSPVCGGAADAVGAVEFGGCGTGVGWCEGVDVAGLDVERDAFLGVVHSLYEHAGDLAGDDVVGDAVCDFGVDLGG